MKLTILANKHMKISSTSLVFREMQIKTRKRCHFPPTRMTIIKKRQRITSIGKDVEKLEPSYTAAAAKSLQSCLTLCECKNDAATMENSLVVLRQVKHRNSLLGVYPKDT